MDLKNYTSGVPADVTIARIERLLVDSGASGIAKEYIGGQVSALMFHIQFEKDRLPVTIKLPANVDACCEAFWKDHCRSRSVRSKKVREDFLEQAARTAWKLQQDWVEVELSLIRLHQKDTLQSFLAYAWDGEKTVYERVKAVGFQSLMLNAPPEGGRQ